MKMKIRQNGLKRFKRKVWEKLETMMSESSK